jgi:putative transposase
MRKQPYPTDLTDEQWAILGPLLPAPKPGGRPRTTDLREVVNALLYHLRSGCQWDMLPRDFPPRSTVHDYYQAWLADGTLDRIHDALRGSARRAAGREESPRVGYMDSQTVQTAHAGGEVGYDAGKKKSGRKRHIIVDSLGLLLAVLVTAADAHDAHAAPDLLMQLNPERLARLAVVWADSAYDAGPVREAVADMPGLELGIVRRPDGVTGWVLLPKRWVVERTFAWLGRYRLLSKDYQHQTASSEQLIRLAMIDRMLHRLAPEPEAEKKPFKYRAAA